MMKWLTNLFVKGYVQANEFITTGGTSSDFVKGDGSLDSNSYALDSDLDNHLLNTTDTLTGDLTVTEQISANGGNSTQWNEAYNWGDHNEEGYATEDWVDSQGYLQSFTETDPTVPSHVKSITTTEKSNWNEAYGWGDHLLEGYLTSVGWADLTGSQSAINLSGFNDDLDYDNYGSWNLKTNGVQRKTIQSGDNLDLVAGTNIGLSYGADGKVTINSSFNNTTYTAGTGLDLTGTEFSFDTVWGDGRYLQSFTETDPTVPSHVKNITTGNISDWDGKAELSDIKNGVLTLSTGTGLTGSSSFSANQSGDETFNVAIASGYTLPTNTQVSNWDTAHTWGDHSTEGYLTSNQMITLSGDVSGSGSTDISVTIAPSSVEAGMLNNNIISGKTALTSGLVSTDELMISDAGTIKRMDVSVLQFYMQSNLAFSNNSGTVTSVATGTGLTGGTITSTGTISLDSSSISSLALADTALQPSDLNGYATETYVDTEIANLVDNSPAALDTLNELAAALGDDPNFATTVSNQIGLKADKSTSILAGTGLNGGGTLEADRTLSVKYGTTAGTAAQGNDSRLSNSREWTATVVSQAEAEAGTATTARKWTAQRVRQAILGWWNGSSDKTKLDGIESGAQVNTVTSVAGQTGDVTLTHTDVNAAPASHTHPLSQITDAGDLASLSTNSNTSNFLRGDGTWATPPNTNTTYSEITTAEIDAGTASTLRTITGRRMKHALDKKSDTGHGHVIGDVTGLQTAINSKANVSHTHTLSQITDAGSVAGIDTNANTSNFLRGDGTWATPPNTNTTYSEISTAEIDAGTSSASRAISGRRMKYALDKKADVSHTHTLSQITDAGNVASLSTNASTSNFLRGDGTWATPPNTNTTYTEISTAEIDAGTASTSRAISGRRMKYALDKKSDTDHGHVIGDVTGLQTAIDSKANTTTQVIAGTGLTGGGTLAANRTLNVTYGTTAGTAAQGNDSRLSNSREWTASVVSQTEAQAGTATTARKWTAQRVAQAIGALGLKIGTTASTAKAGNWKPTWADVTGKPSTFTPSAHTHTLSQITDAGNVAGIDTNASTSNFLRGDGTWATPPNTTYSEITTAEIDAGTASTRRAITGRRMKYALDNIDGLKKIGDGYGLKHQVDNPTYYGTLGGDAINLSNSDSVGNYGATDDYSYAEGFRTTASGAISHAEGSNTTASGQTSHAEGANTTALGTSSHAEGTNTNANGNYSHAEGQFTTAGGTASHSEGRFTTASGLYSHSEGDNTTASGRSSHAEGNYTTAGSFAENARGTYNEIITPISTTAFNKNDVIESVGVGTSNSIRKNALTRWKNGGWKWLMQDLKNVENAVKGFHATDLNGRLNYYDGSGWKKYLIAGEGGSGGGGTLNGHKKTFVKDFANPHSTAEIYIDTTEFDVGDEWIITYQGSAMPYIKLDNDKKQYMIDVGVDFQPNVKSRIYLHLVEISNGEYYFDITITPITLL